MKISNKRTLQAKKTKDLIIQNFIYLLEGNDFSVLSIQDICKFSNISVGAFYHHFPTKNDLLVEFFKRCEIDIVNEKLEKDIATEGSKQSIINHYIFDTTHYLRYDVNLIQHFLSALLHIKNDFFTSTATSTPSQIRKMLILAKKNKKLKSEADIEKLVENIDLLHRGILFNWALSNNNFDCVQKVNDILNDYLNNYFMD